MSTQTEGPAAAAYVIPTFTVGDRLRKARQVTGLEQAEFADQVGIARTTVINYENDRVKPRTIVLRAWSLRTGVPVEWLLDGESPDPHEAGRGSEVLPRLDLNQRPSGYVPPQVRAGAPCGVTPLRRASGTARARRVIRSPWVGEAA